MSIEHLEARRLMSATAFMKGNQLRIFGDNAAANTIQVTQDAAAGTTTVSITTDDGAPALSQSFTTRKVRSIRIEGGAADDTITVGTDAQPIRLNTFVAGKYGADVITTSSGRDTIYGGFGNDTVFAGAGNDSVMGDAGHDELHGGTGDDTLKGGSGDDTLEGDAGNDRLYGQDNNDTLHGSSGRDWFYVSFGRRNDADIEDFDSSDRDRIVYVFDRPWPF
jgi:Ca2+-binding RTX toxin-like protein